MTTARSELGAAALGDRIFVAGGIRWSGTTDRFEEFDTGRGVWRRRADLPLPLHHPALTAVEGRLLLCGGYRNLFFDPVPLAYLYEPAQDRWQRLPDMPAARGEHAAVFAGGRVLVIAGRGPAAARVWSWNPQRGTWSDEDEPIPTPRHHAAVAVLDGLVYVAGGRDAHGRNLSVLERYDPGTRHWVPRAPMPRPQGAGTAAAWNGELHVVGGEDLDRGEVIARHWIYDPKRDRWREGLPLPTARHGLASAVAAGVWWVIGGATGAGWRTPFRAARTVEAWVPPGGKGR